MYSANIQWNFCFVLTLATLWIFRPELGHPVVPPLQQDATEEEWRVSLMLILMWFSVISLSSNKCMDLPPNEICIWYKAFKHHLVSINATSTFFLSFPAFDSRPNCDLISFSNICPLPTAVSLHFNLRSDSLSSYFCSSPLLMFRDLFRYPVSTLLYLLWTRITQLSA